MTRKINWFVWKNYSKMPIEKIWRFLIRVLELNKILDNYLIFFRKLFNFSIFIFGPILRRFFLHEDLKKQPKCMFIFHVFSSNFYDKNSRSKCRHANELICNSWIVDLIQSFDKIKFSWNFFSCNLEIRNQRKIIDFQEKNLNFLNI